VTCQLFHDSWSSSSLQIQFLICYLTCHYLFLFKV
jgi:hypothetical protein